MNIKSQRGYIGHADWADYLILALAVAFALVMVFTKFFG